MVFDISKSKQVEEGLKENNKKLKKTAHYDGLTNVFNRLYMSEKIQEEFHKAKKKKDSFVSVMIDLDDFKTINDQFGHNVGDQVLIKLVEILKNNLQEGDTISQWVAIN